MAKKKTSGKTKSFSEAIGLQYIFNNTITDFFLGLALLVVAVVMMLAMISFLSTGAADQSLLENMQPGEWTNTQQLFQNYCGSMGAILSYWLMAVNFGFPAFLIPCFVVMVGFQLMNVYRVNLWKWFFCMMVVMIWSSVTFAKFLTPIFGSLIFNPGGKHGMFVVQTLENVIGPPGLTAILLFVAIAFLTYITTETITIVRKALNPIGYISNKVKFEITNHREELEENNAIDEAYRNAAQGTVQDEEDEMDENSQTRETTPDQGADQNQESSLQQEMDKEQKDGNEKTTSPIDLDAAAADDSQQADADKNVAAPSLIQQQRELRAQRAERERQEMAAAAAASAHIGMDISVATGEEKATSNTVSNAEVLNTPINPKEPFTRYKYPTLNLLKKYDGQEVSIDEEEQKANKNRIIEVLGNFGVQIKTIRATVGPTITLYEIQPAEGVRISKIKNLEDDIALSLSALGIRIIAPMPGKGTIGIEVPNKDPQIVSMQSVIATRKFQESKYDLPVVLGKTITNDIFMFDLCKMPHLLVAGATGQGKSVGLNAIITSLLYRKHPSELKFVLVDPKMVEFGIYAELERHYLAKLPDADKAVITDCTKVIMTLNSVCKEMDDRYELLMKAHVRNIKEYNAKFISRHLNPEKGHKFMPFIVVIIDEFGDLIMQAGKEIETPIARIAQKARAVGIHMIIATQRPSTNIITGIIKANFPARMAFRVMQMVDSRTILDAPGANQLIGRGDLLFSQGGETTRVQCAFVDTPEVERIVNFISEQAGYPTAFLLPEYVGEGGEEKGSGNVDLSDRDPLFEEAARLIVIQQQGSTSLIQRKFAIGYNRAGRLMDQLEAAGIVGPFEGSKARQVLIQDEYSLEQLLNALK